MKFYRYCRILSGWDLKDLKRQPRFGIIHCSATSDFSIALFYERHGGAALGWSVASVILNILIGSTAGRICLASEEILQFARLVWLQAKDCRSKVKEATLPWQWRVIFLFCFFRVVFVILWILGFCFLASLVFVASVRDSKSKMLQMSIGRTRGSRGMTWTEKTRRITRRWTTTNNNRNKNKNTKNHYDYENEKIPNGRIWQQGQQQCQQQNTSLPFVFHLGRNGRALPRAPFRCHEISTESSNYKMLPQSGKNTTFRHENARRNVQINDFSFNILQEQCKLPILPPDCNKYNANERFKAQRQQIQCVALQIHGSWQILLGSKANAVNTVQTRDFNSQILHCK